LNYDTINIFFQGVLQQEKNLEPLL